MTEFVDFCLAGVKSGIIINQEFAGIVTLFDYLFKQGMFVSY